MNDTDAPWENEKGGVTSINKQIDERIGYEDDEADVCGSDG